MSKIRFDTRTPNSHVFHPIVQQRTPTDQSRRGSLLSQRMAPRTRSDSRRATADRELPEATGPDPLNHRFDAA